jgi:hypothetical protein
MREAVENETCPISTEGWTRRVQLVWEGGGLLLLRAAPLAAARGAPRPPLSAAPPRAGNGNEKNLELCPHGPWARVDCDHSMDAGVCCQVPFPPPPPHPALCRTVRARPHNRRCARARAWPGALRSGRFSRPGSCLCGRGRGCEPRAPLLFRTKWTRLVHPSVLIGHDILPRQGKKLPAPRKATGPKYECAGNRNEISSGSTRLVDCNARACRLEVPPPLPPRNTPPLAPNMKYTTPCPRVLGALTPARAGPAR